MTDFEKLVQCRQSLEIIRDHSLNHIGSIALARHALSLIFDVPVTNGRPNPPEPPLRVLLLKLKPRSPKKSRGRR